MREYLESGWIDRLWWLDTLAMLADGMTKRAIERDPWCRYAMKAYGQSRARIRFPSDFEINQLSRAGSVGNSQGFALPLPASFIRNSIAMIKFDVVDET